ncbi:MAG: hypothetical protein M3M85_00240 [bacterium]|nr:hypothetical protein [bacterium]
MMSPYKRFFQLAYQVLGWVVKGTVTIYWLNERLATIMRQGKPQHGGDTTMLPPRAFSEKRERGKKYLRREVESWELNSDDWNIIIEFCKNKNQRFLALAEYFRVNNNALTSRCSLVAQGFVFAPFSLRDFQIGVNTPFWQSGLNYALRGPGTKRQSTRGSKEEELRFCRLRVVN